jgi:hypothetical protein
MQTISIRFLRFKGFSQKRFALAAMGKSRITPWEGEGLVFAKHLGVGKGNGFSLIPDFSTYAFLGVFESEAHSSDFFSRNAQWLEYASQSGKVTGWDAFAIKGHGTWNQQQPFQFYDLPSNFDGQIAVITRASIRWSQAWRFWMNVPESSKNIELQEGLLLAKGVGELPIVEQATFSLWNSQKELDQFAYRSRQHAPMIKKTRQYNWYKEEMFIRMAIFKMYDV